MSDAALRQCCEYLKAMRLYLYWEKIVEKGVLIFDALFRRKLALNRVLNQAKYSVFVFFFSTGRTNIIRNKNQQEGITLRLNPKIGKLQ